MAADSGSRSVVSGGSGAAPTGGSEFWRKCNAVLSIASPRTLPVGKGRRGRAVACVGGEPSPTCKERDRREGCGLYGRGAFPYMWGKGGEGGLWLVWEGSLPLPAHSSSVDHIGDCYVIAT